MKQGMEHRGGCTRGTLYDQGLELSRDVHPDLYGLSKSHFIVGKSNFLVMDL